jgi:GNAT superfamily N-acetyltransferase
MSSLSELTVIGPGPVAAAERAEVAARVAFLDRAAYRDSDPLPGLPPPDGSVEDSAVVERELADGMEVCFARDSAGRDVGVMRLVEREPGRWMLLRLAIDPAWKGRGVGRLLFDHVEETGRRRGASSYYFHAVVERGRPQMWVGRGYRVVARWPSDDKPLTEVTMERDPGEPPAPIDYPWQGDQALPSEGAMICWFLVGAELVATASLFRGDPRDLVREGTGGGQGALLVGGDVWPGAGADQLDELHGQLGALGSQRRDRVHSLRSRLPRGRSLDLDPPGRPHRRDREPTLSRSRQHREAARSLRLPRGPRTMAAAREPRDLPDPLPVARRSRRLRLAHRHELRDRERARLHAGGVAGSPQAPVMIIVPSRSRCVGPARSSRAARAPVTIWLLPIGITSTSFPDSGTGCRSGRLRHGRVSREARKRAGRRGAAAASDGQAAAPIDRVSVSCRVVQFLPCSRRESLTGTRERNCCHSDLVPIDHILLQRLWPSGVVLRPLTAVRPYS